MFVRAADQTHHVRKSFASTRYLHASEDLSHLLLVSLKTVFGITSPLVVVKQHTYTAYNKRNGEATREKDARKEREAHSGRKEEAQEREQGESKS